MGVKDLPSVNYVNLHTQAIRKIHITVEVLNKENEAIDTIQGLATSGSINISGESLLRRAGSIEFVYLDGLLPKPNSRLWITNKIRVYAGIENLSSTKNDDDKVTHFCLGTYYITEPDIVIDSEGKTISIMLEDYMMAWEEKQTESVIKLEADTPLHTSVDNLMNLNGEWDTRVQFSDLKIPYTLEYPVGTPVMEILENLRDLYMDWNCYYDLDGTFVFERTKIQREDGEPVAWRFEGKEDLITSLAENVTYKGLKNRVVVFGGLNEKTGETPKSEANINLEDSPFHKDKIDERTLVVVEETYTNRIQCDSRARYELFKASTFQEKLDFTSLPIYFLDANNLIEAKSPSTNEIERYVIDSIDLDLGVESEMSVTSHRVYYDHFDIIGEIGDYQKSADIIEEGILNKGWLSLAEERIKEFYGMEGSGSDLIVRFEYDAPFGTTAYTTGYVGSTTQSLTIDLADFEDLQGDSGDGGNGKAEYADRVFGHEMVHIVMNDYLTVKKTVELPHWFKEGTAEFIHGADERLKLSIVVNGSIDEGKLNKVIERANELSKNYVWKGDSDDYSASYLMIKYLDKRFKTGKSYKDLLEDIKKSNKDANISLKESILNNANFTTYEDFSNKLSSELRGFINTSMTLNLDGDEVDTGSIGGSDHRGTKNLNAESVFDNSKAVRGLDTKGFNVEIRKP